MNYSELSRRFWAFFFDSIIVSGIYYGLLMILRMSGITTFSLQDLIESNFSVFAYFYISYGLFYIVYEIGFLSSNLSATPGKIILEMEVVCTNASFYKVLLRSLVKVISILTGLYIILFTIAVFNEYNQTAHDLLSGCFVIDVDNKKYSTDLVKSKYLYDEMKNRELKTYSEQKALAEEIYGKPNKSTNILSSSFVWILVLFISIASVLIYTKTIYSDAKNYFESLPQSKDHTIKLE